VGRCYSYPPMSGANFIREFESRLLRTGDSPLLNIALFPDFANPVRLTGPEIVALSTKLAADCVSSANEQQVVLLLLPHSVELFLLHIGLVLRGLYPAVLPWPTTRVDRAKYQRNLLHQLNHLAAGCLITVPSLAHNLRNAVPFPVVGCELKGVDERQQLFPAEVDLTGTDHHSCMVPVPPSTPGDCVFFQFSGGTTGSQKSVAISARMLVNQLDRLADTLQFAREDGTASWLPLYHDMGLISCLWLPLWTGAPSVHLSASDWLLNPQLLFRYLEEFNATFCWLPNFAFSYLAQRQHEMSRSYSLSHVRAFVNCSEPVRSGSMRDFSTAFEPWGVRPEALQASYAMAENVFAVTQTPVGSRPCTWPRERVTGSRGRSAFSLEDDVFVSSGQPLPDMEIRVMAADGTACAPGIAGEIQIRTPSLFDGYFTREGCSRGSFTADGWYGTGDYGFIGDRDLYVIGRTKDMVIVGGQNVFPEDIEYVSSEVPGVYPGRVVAFGLADQQYGTESLAVVAELRGPFSEEKALRVEGEIRKAVLAFSGIAPRHVAVVPERWILKSTAGKISRRETKERFLDMHSYAASPAPQV
jgi:fatty-acyl-CoA synthase